MQTHFFMETVTTASGVWAAGARGVCVEPARERFFQMNEQMNEWFKKKKSKPKIV